MPPKCLCHQRHKEPKYVSSDFLRLLCLLWLLGIVIARSDQKEKTMTLPHHNATATITIDGLAVCCFNKAQNKWEVGFLHPPMSEPQHALILKIDDEGPIQIPDTTSQITFSATNPQMPNFPGSANGFFAPLSARPGRHSFPTTADELEDFRWIINLQDPADSGHGNATPKRATFRVTRAFMQHAVFYTSRVASRPVLQTPFTRRREHDPNEMDDATRQRHVFGRTNDETSADIYCAPGNGAVTITIPGAEPRVLQHRPGNPWKICLTNLCIRPVDTGKPLQIGDFHLFYDILSVSGQKRAIWGTPANPQTRCSASGLSDKMLTQPPDKIVSGRVDCDITWLGASNSLDAIIPAA